MSKRPAPRRLVDFGAIAVRRTVAAPAGHRTRPGWSCRVFKALRAGEVSRGADLWSAADRSRISELMGAA